MIISLIFAVANAYFAYEAYKAKRWGWFAFSAILAAFCSYQVITATL